MMPGNQGNTKGDRLYKYNPAVEKIRIAFLRKMRYNITDLNGVKNIESQNVIQL